MASGDEKLEDGIVVKQSETGDAETAVELPGQWGTPFLRELRCE